MFEILILIFEFIDLLVDFIFFFVPDIFRIFSLSLLTLTIGIVLDCKKKTKYKVLKWIIYLLFMIYSAYTIGILDTVGGGIDVIDFTVIVFGIVAPICMMVVGQQIVRMRIKGHKIFNHYVMWFIYLLVHTLWAIFVGTEEMFYGFVWLYFILNMIVIYYYLGGEEGRDGS